MLDLGVILLVIGVALLVLELHVSGGVAGTLGALALTASVVTLSNTNSELADALAWAGVALLIGGVSTLLLISGKLKGALGEPIQSGPESLIGRSGEVRGGLVFVDGALWESDGDLPEEGSVVTVTAVSGLKLKVS